MQTICPKCQYQRTALDAQVHAGICPRCGIAYAKFVDTSGDQNVKQKSSTEAELDFTLFPATQAPAESFSSRLLATLTYVPEKIDSATFWARVTLYVLFIIWGVSFMLGGVDWESVGGSFMHNINLPFHEFGHVLFGFFGRFMGILGGSLFQIIFPLFFTVAFTWQMHDNFAAAITLWWCGQNFIDVAPYIADAKYRAIPLILGLGEDFHDWGNLLTMTNSVESANTIANISFTLGCLIMLLSYVWGGWILWQQKQRLN